jgi:hypothetical protein
MRQYSKRLHWSVPCGVTHRLSGTSAPTSGTKPLPHSAGKKAVASSCTLLRRDESELSGLEDSEEVAAAAEEDVALDTGFKVSGSNTDAVTM